MAVQTWNMLIDIKSIFHAKIKKIFTDIHVYKRNKLKYFSFTYMSQFFNEKG